MSGSLGLAEFPPELLDHVLRFLLPPKGEPMEDVFGALFPLTCTCQTIRPLAEKIMREAILVRPGVYDMDVTVFLARYLGRDGLRPAPFSPPEDKRAFFYGMPASLLEDLIRTRDVRHPDVYSKPHVEADRLVGMAAGLGLCVWGQVATIARKRRGSPSSRLYPWITIHGIQVPTEKHPLVRTVQENLQRLKIRHFYRNQQDGFCNLSFCPMGYANGCK